MSRVLSYEEKDTWIHRLSGVTKLLFFLLWSITGMISYDTRVLLVMLVCSLIIFVEDEVEAGRYGIQVHHVFSGDQSHRHFLLFSGTGDEDLRNGDADSASVWTLHADKRAAVL